MVAKKAVSDSDSSSDAEVEVIKGKKAAPAKKAAKKESSSESSSEEEKPVKKAAPAKKAAKKEESSSDSESDKPVKKAPAKKAAKKDSSDSGSSSEEEKPVKKAAKKAAASSSSSDAEEAAPAKVAEPVAVAGNAEDADKLELFIKSLSFDVDENMLYEIFSKYGTMTKTKLVSKDGRSRGIAFVEYETHENAQKALTAENGNSHCGREIQVEFSGSKPADGGAPVSGVAGESTCIFCGNIGFYTTEETIRGFFSQKGGNVAAVRIATDMETGRARGFCHVEMETPEMAQ